METIIATLLLSGVLLATAVVCVGAVIYLGQARNESPHYAIFRGEPSDLCSVGGILADLAVQRPRDDPIRAVVADRHAGVSGGGVAGGICLEARSIYSVVSLIVLSLLLYSLFLGTL